MFNYKSEDVLRTMSKFNIGDYIYRLQIFIDRCNDDIRFERSLSRKDARKIQELENDIVSASQEIERAKRYR